MKLFLLWTVLSQIISQISNLTLIKFLMESFHNIFMEWCYESNLQSSPSNGYLICQVLYSIILKFVTLKRCKVIYRLIFDNFYFFTLHTDYLNNKVGDKKSYNFELNHSPSNKLDFFYIHSFLSIEQPLKFTINLCTTPCNSVLCLVLVYIMGITKTSLWSIWDLKPLVEPNI